jgi:hypothetical protein
MAEFNSPFSPFGAPKPEEELLYPEQGMQFGGTGNSLFGAQPTDGGVDPTVLAGLGLGGGIVAAGTGGQAATSQVLSPMAQKIAAQDAARQSAAAAQARVNNRIIGSNMPSGGANPTVTGSVKPGTLQNPSNIIGRNLPSGGANPQVTGRIKPGTLGSMARPAAGLAALGGAGAFSTTVAPATAALIGGYLGGKAVDNLGGDAMRGLGLTDRDGSMATMAGEIIGEGLYGDSNLSAFSPEESASIQQGTVASDQMATPESVAGLSFTGTPLTQEAITNPQLQFSGSQPNQVSSTEPTVASDQTATRQVRAGRSQQRQGQLNQQEPAVTTTADEGGFFSPGGFGYEYLGGRLGETIGQFVGEQKYGTGLDVEGGATGRPLNPRGLPGQTATLGASALELIGDYGIDPVVTAAQVVPEYVTGLDLTDSSLIDTPAAAVQPAAPEIPQGAPGSPQAFFEEYRSKGPLTPEQIARGEAAAARMGTTFNPDTGFSQTPVQPGVATPVTSGLVTQSGIPLSEFLSGAAIPSAGLRAESPMYADNSMSRGFTGDAGRAAYEAASAEREARLAARMQQPGESITERDTRNAAARTQSSVNVPTDVREAMLTPEGRRTAKQINRLARWSGSTQGQEMGGVAGLEQSLQPVDAQQQQYDAMRLYKLGLEIDKMQQEKPSEYQEAAAGVDEAIAAGSIKPEDRNKFILRDLGWQAKEGEDSSDLMSIIYGDSSKSGGEPVLVKTQEEYNNLAKGTRYTDEDGNIATKK